ncbi:MAG: enoyl-CoA hydratase/isomerase family protein [Alphaproteobacteria bacterium]|nr:enoyl-CoA hydratase/isomerase family protein [Alphaproteobacteria bacterium]
MAYQQIKAEQRGEVLLLTLNRPDKLNAWTPQMMVELVDAIEGANANKAIGAIVVTGEGRGFCAGADIEAVFKSRIQGNDPGANTAGGQGGLPSGLDWIGLCRSSKPLVAAVNGHAVGIGTTMILPFDFIVASDAAKFALPFVKMGIVPELASSYFLQARIGFGRASDLMLSGRSISGQEAFDLGLANAVVPAEGLMDKALGVARAVAANPDPMLRMTKELLSQNALERDMNVVQERESEKLRICWATPEHKEAVAAFMEKRPARFR